VLQSGAVIRLKRAYDPPAPEDGERFLVDGLWPRGLARKALALTAWLRELAPSGALRRWFGHRPERWEEFRRRYREELMAPAKRALLLELAQKARQGNVTLLYAARDGERNNAVVLKEVLEEVMASL